MSKIKILMIIGTLDYSNGVTNYTINYLKKINKELFQVDFIVHDNIKNNFYNTIVDCGGKVYFMDNISARKIPQFYKNIDEIMSKEKYDIVHCHLLNISFLYFILAKKYKIKIKIIHSHATKYAEKRSRILRNFLLGKIGLHLSNTKFACSNLAGKFLYKNKKYYLINNAIDINKYEFNKKKYEELRNKLKISNKIVLGHIGRFSEQKNHMFLIDILAELNDEKYTLVLLGSGHLVDSVKEYAKEKNVFNNIVFVGNVDNPYDYYNVFDYFLLPSFFEGLPVVGIEAQANGVPCIFSDTITKEVKCNNNIRFLSINSVDEWVKLIRNNEIKRLNSPSTYLKENYDIEMQVKKLENIYLKLVK